MSAVLDFSKALKHPGQIYAFEASTEIGDMEVLMDPVSFEDVAVRGEFVGAGERVSVRAEVTATVHSRCSRCLEPVTMPLAAQLDAQYARETDPDDPDLYSFEGPKADITDAVRDALILELPYRFLCSEDCKGLCPHCGINLNLGTCTCQEGAKVTNPFSALKSIVQNNEEV